MGLYSNDIFSPKNRKKQLIPCNSVRPIKSIFLVTVKKVSLYFERSDLKDGISPLYINKVKNS